MGLKHMANVCCPKELFVLKKHLHKKGSDIMNLSILVKRIKIDLGIYGLALPIENLDELIIDVIQDITLPVFSIYQPFEQTMYLDMNKLDKIEKTASYEAYLLPDFQERKLLSIKDVRYDDRSLSGMGYWGGTIPFLHNGITNQLILSNASNALIGTMLPKMNFQFIAPRTIYLYNCIASYSLIYDMLFEHDRSLMSIPPTAEESFFKLALLDTKASLYGLMKHYNNIQTAYGTIELKIDDWADASNERKQLLEDWDNVYNLDLGQITWS